MARVENYPISNRTELFTRAKFASVKAMTDVAEPAFPSQEKVKPQNPSLDVQRMILFFKAPNQYNSSQFSNFITDEERMVAKVGTYPWSSSMPANGTRDSELKKERTRSNIAESIRLVQDGCKIYDEKRKTGESTYIHFLRTLVRGNSELRYVGFDRESTLYTSSIARVIHDSKEDFDGFKIEPTIHLEPSDQTSVIQYEVSFDNQRGGRNIYHLQLNQKEAKLLKMQIDALSIPPEINKIVDNHAKTKAQIHHLITKTREIYSDFNEDAFAAYQTIRIKLDDRIDNILTYYAAGKGGNDTARLYSKLKETIIFFREVEQEAKFYFGKYMSIIRKDSHRELKYPYADTAESLVHFCYYLLFGGTYDEFFAEYLDKAEFGFIKSNAPDVLETLTSDDLFIPSLNPAANPIRVSKRFHVSSN